MMLTADTLTDEMICALKCATCASCEPPLANPATCIGRYEDMAADEPSCDLCCGHGCEDGHCDPLFDEDGDVASDVEWHDDNKAGTRMRTRVAEFLNARGKVQP